MSDGYEIAPGVSGPHDLSDPRGIPVAVPVRNVIGNVLNRAVQDAVGLIVYDLAPPPGLWETRHHCLGRPERWTLAVGESWTCPECDSVWTITEEESACRECGTLITERTWDYRPGNRIGTAPKHQPYAFVPMRNIVPRASKCYRLASGAKVHVKPGCRCKTRGSL